MVTSKASLQRETALRTTRDVAQVWEDRKSLVKQEMAAQSAANDAKTARLRALRLAKEAQDAEAARAAAQNAPAPVPKKRVKRGD
jgi:hypothetical protein